MMLSCMLKLMFVVIRLARGPLRNVSLVKWLDKDGLAKDLVHCTLYNY